MKAYITLRHEAEGAIKSRIIEGIVTEDKITYKDEGFIVTLKKKNDEVILTKKNKDYKITINFKQGTSTYAIYETIGHQLSLNVMTVNLKNEEEIYIHYIVEEINEIKYSLKYEVKEWI